MNWQIGTRVLKLCRTSSLCLSFKLRFPVKFICQVISFIMKPMKRCGFNKKNLAVMYMLFLPINFLWCVLRCPKFCCSSWRSMNFWIFFWQFACVFLTWIVKPNFTYAKFLGKISLYLLKLWIMTIYYRAYKLRNILCL